MNESAKPSRMMTVAHVREHEDRDYYEVMFLESARFYRLPKTNAAFDDVVVTLRRAKDVAHAVRVILNAVNGEVIEDVQAE